MNKLYSFGDWVEWNESWLMDSHLSESEIHDMYLADLAWDTLKDEPKPKAIPDLREIWLSRHTDGQVLMTIKHYNDYLHMYDLCDDDFADQLVRNGQLKIIDLRLNI